MSQNKSKNVIYILTNPSFPQPYIKIGYADDVLARVKILNSNPGIPYDFHIFATYEVNERLEDLNIHKIIDTLNPTIRCQENNGRKAKEFFAMKPETAFAIFQGIAEISGTKDRLHRWEETSKEKAEKETVEEIQELNKNRHHFKEITFSSSLTGRTYDSRTNPDGSLGIFEHDTGKEVISFSKPSKKQIVRQALIDLGQAGDNSLSLYQLMHKLQKVILGKSHFKN